MLLRIRLKIANWLIGKDYFVKENLSHSLPLDPLWRNYDDLRKKAKSGLDDALDKIIKEKECPQEATCAAGEAIERYAAKMEQSLLQMIREERKKE